MTIEDTLSSIDASLKTIVTILQSAGAIGASSAPAASAPDAGEATTTRKRRTKAEIAADEAAAAAAGKTAPTLGLVDGDPEGTRYWVSDELQTAYAQKPGDPDPQPQSFKLTSATDYLEKKAAFAAKKDQAVAQPATTTHVTAAPEPSATAPAATASEATSAGPTWKEVLAALQDVNKSTKAGHGRDGILALLKQFGCEGKTVPALEPLGKHAAILAAARAMLDGEAAVTDDLGLGL